MKFGFVAKHRGVWPVAWLCEALGVSRSGFHAWLRRSPGKRSLADEAMLPVVRASFVASARTYGARRVWRDVLETGVSCGLHKIERLMRANALRARPRRRALPKDDGQRLTAAIAPNVLDRQFTADQPNRKWIADFTYVWTAEGWLYVAAVIDLFSRRVVGWSMKPEMNAQLESGVFRPRLWCLPRTGNSTA
jgi:putative transposase